MILNIVLLVVGFVVGVLVGRVNTKSADKLASAASKVQTGVMDAAKKIKN